MPFVDYFSPMVYPSHYGSGVFNIAVPNEHPYEMIDQTLEIMNRQSSGLRMKIRPWIHRISALVRSGNTPRPISMPRCRRWSTTTRRAG